MSKSRVPLLVGATAVGGIGYYLYQAGGEPSVARKQAEGMRRNSSPSPPPSIISLFLDSNAPPTPLRDS